MHNSAASKMINNSNNFSYELFQLPEPSHEETMQSGVIAKSYCRMIISEEFETALINEGISVPDSLASACLKRRCHYLSGRKCCLDAYRKLKLKTFYLPEIGKNNEPIWPSGITGSISHNDSEAIAIITLHPDFLIGVDIETYLKDEIAQETLPHIVNENELDFLKHFSSQSKFVTYLFSAKETIYKAFYRMTQAFFDFSAVSVVQIEKDLTKLKFVFNIDLPGGLKSGSLVEVGCLPRPDSVETYIITPKH